MNEFIVWDNKFEKFIYPCNEVLMTIKDGLLKGIKGGDGFVEEWEAFQCIGKTDIEGNKIYADCSIVNTNIVTNETRIELNGYFKYDNVNLRYNFHKMPFDNTSAYNIIVFKDDRFSRIKIIGTLQENPELLKEMDQC